MSGSSLLTLPPLDKAPSSPSKLSSGEDPSRAAARQRNRSLKKSQAVQDDEPTTTTSETTRRASSFDVAQCSVSPKMSPANLRPGSFDASSRSAFSPVEVPRLLVHSPLSPLQLEPSPAPDSRLLTVPSPDFRKSPIDTTRNYACESPKPTSDFFPISLAPQLISQLMGPHSLAIGPLEDLAKAQLSREAKMEQMDCSGSFETLGSGSFDFTSSSVSFDHSHSVSATPEIMAQMPPKSLIQDDIRSGNGRFQLVRKRGRSEVWNLFGQVIDTSTGVRLPYVACYACKVLYTDTGGGTGNMTRHRCPIGASYRNSSTHGSSTETVEAAASFDSAISAAVRVVADSRLPLNVSTEPVQPTASQLIPQLSGEATIGDVDREVLTEAMVKCCALDLIDPIIFSGKGFQGLLEKLWQLYKVSNRRCIETFPDTGTIKSAMQTHLRFCTDDLKNELSRTPQGVRLTLETLSYCGRDYKVVHGARISHDWKWRSNILGVFKAGGNESVAEMINIVVHNYELDKSLLRVVTSSDPNALAPIKTFVDVKEKLKQVLVAVLSTCSIPLMQMLNTIDQLTKAMVEKDVRLPFECVSASSDIFDFHRLLAEFNDHWAQIEQILAAKYPHLLPTFHTLNQNHMRELKLFLDPFKETVDSLLREQPNFQRVVPEWSALLHECQQTEDEASPLQRELRAKTTELMVAENDNVVTVDHRIASILNPRLIRKLDMILTESERVVACEKIRALCGIRSPKEPLSRGSSCDGEPHRKRRMFLSSLEDDLVGDELECYLRSQYPAEHTKDVITFWSTSGQAQFPALSSLARRTLSTPATAPRTVFDSRIASVSQDQLHTFLMLRSMFDSEKDEPSKIFCVERKTTIDLSGSSEDGGSPKKGKNLEKLNNFENGFHTPAGKKFYGRSHDLEPWGKSQKEMETSKMLPQNRWFVGFRKSFYWLAHNHKKIGLRHFCMLLLVLTYTLLGAALFYSIESRHELEMLEVHKHRLELMSSQMAYLLNEAINDPDFSTNVSHVKGFVKDLYIRLLKEEDIYTGSTYFKVEDTEHNLKWSLGSAIFFSMNVYTTTGYGSIAPDSTEGKAFVIIYGLLFVPLTLVVVRDLGQWVLVALTRVYASICIRLRWIQRVNDWKLWKNLRGGSEDDVDEDELISLPMKFCVSLMFGYLLFCTCFIYYYDGFFGAPNTGITLFHSFYFSFISISTIGLGDVMPNHVPFSPLITALFFFGMPIMKVVNRVTYVSFENGVFGTMTVLENRLDRVWSKNNGEEEENPSKVTAKGGEHPENETNEHLNNLTIRSIATFMRSHDDVYGGGFGRVAMRRSDLRHNDV
ncbi:unnamed protein product [Caenorhabditis auriculariae]|uniref:BED-type domain-containing protein n=1 Tax=Caenorhabditis auriculariae TaxID=2777116 RepID=A0A8S1HNQ1_9PELO|nr:unnamed protein product [Caenorhabditis auriculariae]